MEPLISVLIPSYNYGHFVTTAIESALRQTYPNVEVIVSDNCSTDGTVPMLRKRYADERRVRIFENERNVGLVPNFNRALTHAHGEFVLWCSADDWLLPPHLNRLHHVFRSHPSIDVVYSGAYFADEQERVYSRRAMPGQFPVDYVDVRNELVELLTTVCQVCLPTALFRRASFEELGPMDESFGVAADWEIAVRLAINGKRFAFLAEPSMCVRLHGAQASGEAYSASGASAVEFLAILEKYLDHPGMAEVTGRERSIAELLDGLIRAAVTVSKAGGRDQPENFDDAFTARVVALKTRLFARYEVYEPARVREHRVSVIVPTMGPPPALLRAIDSIADQSFGNWEILVVDQVPFSVENLLASHRAWDRMSVVRFPNALRPGGSRNTGLRMARGEYVTYLDEDNVMRPDHLETLVDTIERTGAEVAVASAALVVERVMDGRFLDVELLGEARIFREVFDPVELGLIANALPLNAVLHHRRLLDRIGGFNDVMQLLEDFDYLIRLEAAARMTFTRVLTLEVHMRISLVSQTLGRVFGHYQSSLNALHAAYPASPAIEEKRTLHREAVERVALMANELASEPQGLAELLGTLAGRAVIPQLQAR